MEFSSGLRQVEGQPVSRSDIDASCIPERQCQQKERGKTKQDHYYTEHNLLDLRQTCKLLIATPTLPPKKKNPQQNVPYADNGRIMTLLGRAEPTQTACWRRRALLGTAKHAH